MLAAPSAMYTSSALSGMTGICAMVLVMAMTAKTLWNVWAGYANEMVLLMVDKRAQG